MTPNEKLATDFAMQFTPPLTIMPTERVNGVKFPDAWQVTYWNQFRGIGITAVVYEGQIHAYLECAGRGSLAAHAGKAFATALGLVTEDADGTP